MRIIIVIECERFITNNLQKSAELEIHLNIFALFRISRKLIDSMIEKLSVKEEKCETISHHLRNTTTKDVNQVPLNNEQEIGFPN